MKFSDEARLLIDNWDVYQEIRKTEAELNGKFRDYLFSIENDLQKQSWWDNSWIFTRYQEKQVYLTNKEWHINESPAIWIGVENFSVETILGITDTATMYVWVPGNRTGLVAALRTEISSWNDAQGEVELKQNNSYVVRDTIRKCLPDELDRFDEIVRKPMIDFFNCFGQKKDLLSKSFRSAAGNE